MDINDLRGISTAFMLIAFISLVVWAYSGKQKKSFDEAAKLPFADEPVDEPAKYPAEYPAEHAGKQKGKDS